MPETRLLVLAPVELTRDPRARRAAAAARDHGLDVVGLCGGGDALPIPFEDVRVVRTRPPAASVPLRRIGLHGMATERPLLRELRGLVRLARLAVDTLRLVRAARREGRFDIVHANDLDTLPAGWLIARRLGARLVYDAHELYTMQEPDPPQLHRAATGLLERLLARRADAVVTVADPIADELQALLGLSHRPLVVLNCPATSDVEQPELREGSLRVVYQGAMGPGRPLADIFSAAEGLEGVSITLRVARSDSSALEQEIQARGLGGTVEVVEPVPPDRLVEALAGFDAGLIINRPSTRNDELVMPNKLFEYLMAGLAVVAPRLPSLSPVVAETGVLFEPARPESLRSALRELAADRGRLAELRRSAWRLARERYNAGVQAEGYLHAWGLAPTDVASG